ncbi:MAG: dihydropteroate synthase [Polyangiaceae bacterium]|nr:dihydropteroate synthase [Polyangiaceae bacterium]
MGVLNVTPDSFFDGGRYTSVPTAEARLRALVAEGADLIDIGGESSRPGAGRVETAEQIRRIAPAVRLAKELHAWVSVDTTEPEVAEFALAHGAAGINDVSCLADPDLARVTARAGALLILMHTRGPLGSMAGFSEYPAAAYRDLVGEVSDEWMAARDRAVQAGMASEQVLCDPGLGFAKNAEQSLELLRRLPELTRTGARLVVGPSRKSFISAIDPSPPEARIGGTIAACLAAAQRGATVLRIHDVATVRQALLVAQAVTQPPALGERREALDA